MSPEASGERGLGTDVRREVACAPKVSPAVSTSPPKGAQSGGPRGGQQRVPGLGVGLKPLARSQGP